MKGVKYNDKNENDLLKSLLSSAKDSLEQKVNELSNEIKNRQALNHQILSTLGTAKMQLEDKLWRLRYSSMFNEAFAVNRDFMRQLMRIEEQITNEFTSCFQDSLKLKLRLQEIREELELEKQKFKLLDFD